MLDASLPAFFAELDSSWRGWAGTKAWVSMTGNLTLEARHDRVGRVLITVTFREPGMDSDSRREPEEWSASVVIALEPAALGQVAASLAALRDRG